MEKVIIYTTPTCPYCHTLMDWLDSINIPYEEKDGSDRDVVPETHIGSDIIIGDDRKKVLKSLKKHGYKI